MHITYLRLACRSADSTIRHRSSLWRCFMALCFTLAVTACSQSQSGGLTITGSTSVTPFAEQLAERYQRAHQPDEAARLDEVVIARDALAVVVNPSNPITGLSQAQIQGIFSGQISSWEALGGLPQPITIVSREAGSGTFGAFDELVMKGKSLTTRVLRQGSNGAIRQIVAEDPNAIGYISLGIIDQTVKALAIDGVEPSVVHVEAGTYKLVRPFLFVWRKGASLTPLAQGF